jgi:hypothetical protein
MRCFFDLASPCRDRAGDGDGGAVADKIDPGAPIEVGSPKEPAAKTADKSEVDKLRDEFNQRIEALQNENRETKESARYWEQRARGAAPPADDPDDDPDEDDTADTRPADNFADITPEKFFEILNSEGPAGLKKFGFMTKADVDAEVRKIQERNDRKLAQAQTHATYDAKLGQEFPELVADNARMQRGEKPQNELTKRTAQIFQEMVADDATLKNSPAAILTAARTAKRLLEAEKKATDMESRTRQQERRDRIDNQRGERDTRGADIDEGNDRMSPAARQITKNLGRFLGDDPDAAVQEFVGGEAPTRRRNGRG